MLFLQSVTKYAEKIKQADEPKVCHAEECRYLNLLNVSFLVLTLICIHVKMIRKDSSAVLNDNSSGVVLKDDPSAGSNGGATWAYEVAGQTMVCPIIVEDLAPPGQMLVEVWFPNHG